MPRSYGLYESAGSQLWTPEQDLAACRLWLDTNYLPLLGLSGTTVTSLGDRTGKNTAGTGSGTTRTWNGVGGGITFASGGVIDNTTAPFSGTVGEFLLVAVASASSASNNGTFSVNNPSSVRVYLPYGDSNVYWDGPNRISTAWGGTFNVPYLWTFRSSQAAGTQTISRSGSVIATGASPGSTTPAGGWQFGGNDTGQFHYGTIYEFIFSTDASALNMALIEGYLWWKWSKFLANLDRLSPSHRFSAAPPLIGG